jgi:hypothetical protein
MNAVLRRLLAGVAVMVAASALLAVADSASAHPLGNFSINHLSRVSVSADHVDVHYILDQAEIPTVQERSLSRAEVLARKEGGCAEVRGQVAREQAEHRDAFARAMKQCQ